MSSAEDAVWNDFIRSEAEYRVSTNGVEASELVDYTKTDKVTFFAGSKSLEFTVEGIPDWIQRMENGGNWFTPAPSFDAIRKVHTVLELSFFSDKEMTISASSGMLFGLGGMATGVAFDSFGMFLALSCSAGLVGAGLGNLVYRLTKFKKKKEAFKAAKLVYDEIGYAGLRTWLMARYNVEVDITVIYHLYENIRQNMASTKFVDNHGKEWIFSRHSSELGWFVEPVVSTAIREASYVEVNTMVAEKETGLPVEAAKLWESLQTNIAKLSGESEAEAEHASLRILEDARSAVQDYRKLVKLGGEVQGESVLVRVLTLLNTETSGLVQERIERVVSNMEVQSEYLHTRQQHAGLHKNEHVQLPAIPEVEHLMETRKS